jgi:ribosomal protein S18 acetylase RimI-like enzyme
LRSFLGAHPEVIDENFRVGWLANDQVRVASLGEQLVGFAVLERMKDREVEITSLFVDPANWRAGIGRALIDAMLSLLSAGAIPGCSFWLIRSRSASTKPWASSTIPMLIRLTRLPYRA